MSDGLEVMSGLTLFLLMRVTFLAYKMHWKESNFFYALAGAFFIGVIEKSTYLFGSEPRFPLFLIIYAVSTVVCLVSGFVELSAERKVRK